METPVVSDVALFVRSLKASGIRLWLEEGRLRYRASAGAMTAGRKEQISARSAEIVQFLGQESLPEEGPFAPSYLQEQFLGYYDSLKSPVIQHVHGVLRLEGALNVQALRGALEWLVRRHEVLRTRFALGTDGKFVAWVRGAAPPEIDILDLSDKPRAVGDREVLDLIPATHGKRFDLMTGPLLRFALVRLSVEEHVLIVVIHHSVADAWSLGIAVRDVSEQYRRIVRGEPAPTRISTMGFYDHVRTVRAWVEGPEGQQCEEHWRKAVAGVREPFWLPPRTRGPAEPRERRPAVRGRIAKEAVEPLRELARGEGATLFLVSLTVLSLALARWSRRSQVFVTVFHSGRDRPELFDVMGCFADVWLSHVQVVGGLSFREALRLVGGSHERARRYFRIPFWRLKQELKRACGDPGLLGIAFNYLPLDLFGGDAGRWRIPQRAGESDLSVQRMDIDEPNETIATGSGIKMLTHFAELQHEIGWYIRFAEEEFEREAIERFSADMEQLFCQAAQFPDAPCLHSDTSVAASVAR